MAKKFVKKVDLEKLNQQEEKILSILREERNRAKERFPLAYALIATFGLVCIISGFNKSIDHIQFLRDYPFILIIVGVIILIITGEAYRRLGK